MYRAVILVLVLLALFLPPCGATNNAEGQAIYFSFNVTDAQNYILSLYNPELGMVRENENIERYWVWSDNELAAKVLTDYKPEIAANITESILHYREAYNIEFKSSYGGLLGKDTSFLAPENKKVTDLIWYTYHNGTSELECTDYADIAFLKAIYYFKAGGYGQAADCYYAGQNMYDGRGFVDKAYREDGELYSTYKIALWKIAHDIANISEVTPDTKVLTLMQDTKTGGVHTHYNKELQPAGQRNIETTGLTIMALDRSILVPKPLPPTPEQLQECRELGIDDNKCTEQAILTERSKHNDPDYRQTQTMDTNAILVLGISAVAVVGGISAGFYYRRSRCRI